MAKKKTVALVIVGAAVVGVALWYASSWVPHAHSGAAPARGALPNKQQAKRATAVGPDTSDMLKMAHAALLACGAPAAPRDMPDGATATREQMVAAHSTVKVFDEATTIYNQCVDTTAYQATVQFKAVASSTDIDTLNALQIQLHNDAIDRDQAVANRFNVQLRRFKARGEK